MERIQGGNVSSLSNNHQIVLKDTKDVQILDLWVDRKKLSEAPGYGDNSGVTGLSLMQPPPKALTNK